MRTVLATASCGALGMLAVIQTSLYYRDVDKLAFSITLMMGAMLAVGVIELLWVARRTRVLRSELIAIPADAEYERVERASPLLRSLLSARLDRTALPVPGPVFAPFILSLLVMLGLLGTFLGLFETLRGAGMALDASADVEALRSGLKAPISGLMRSFGTSAAGVASSSMLGMAAVFVRRDSNRFGVQLHEMASGSLSRFAPARRQLLALETLAEQGRAWPTAAAALEQAVAQLLTLQSSWKQAHAEAAQQTKQELAEATRTIRDAITSGVQHAAASSSDAVRPLLREAVAESGAAVREHLGGLREQLSREADDRKQQQGALQKLAEQQLQQLTARLQSDSEARALHEELLREQAAEHLRTLYARLDEDTRARRSYEESVRAQTSEHLQTLHHKLDADAEARRAHEAQARAQASEQLLALRQQLDADTEARRAAAEALRDGASEHLLALRQQLDADADARRAAAEALRDGASEHLLALRKQLDADAEARRAHEAQTRAQASEQLQTLQQKLDADAETRRAHEAQVRAQVAEHLQSLYARVESDAQARRAHEETVREQLVAQLNALEAGFAQSRSALSELEAERMQALLDGETQRAGKLGAQWQELARTRAEADAGLLAQFEQALTQASTQQNARAEQLGNRFEQLAERVQAAFEQAGERDRERAAALSEVGARMQRDLAEAASVVRERLQHSAEAEATQQARAEELFARLAEASKVIAESAQTQVGALGDFVAATDGRLREAEQRSQQRLGEALAQWAALGKEQAERVAQFEQTLLQQHASTAGALGEQLGEHAAALQEKISHSAELLEQASTLIHGGGAELAAVADSFASAVASQREGARQWLEALGDIERYALEAGEAAAADALGQHLARTHEVFDKQLQFQQELIAQLHGMRSRETSAATRADASA